MYYSDNGVDEKLVEIFGNHVGHACEVGAYDGVTGSSCLALEERGWTVLCVEANPNHCATGITRRKLWRSVAASNQDVELAPFGLYETEIGSAGHTSLGNNTRYPGGGPTPVGIVSVSTRRLDRILFEAGFHKLDLLTVDVEGWEREVIGGFTVERWKPRVIVLEAWDESYAIQIPGYDIIDKKQLDNIYLRSGS